MRFFNGGDLRAQSDHIGAKGIKGRSGEVGAVVDGVDARERVAWGEDVVDASGAEVFANGLQRTAEDLRDSAGVGGQRRWRRADAGEIGVGGGWRRPEIEERCDGETNE